MKVGDVVVLRAGGPEMVVDRIGKPRLGRQPVSCVWFAGTKRFQGVFDVHVLRKVVADATNCTGS